MDVHLTAVGTAVPGHRFEQQQILKFMEQAHGVTGKDAVRLKALYRASGIHYRHSVVPDYDKTDAASYAFFPPSANLQPFPSTSHRMAWFKTHALPLSAKAIQNCLAKREDISPKDITHLIVISCTGFYAPGLDIELVEELGLASDVERTCVQFMGCYAAFNGLKLASQFCKADPEAKVLIVCTELCTLHFQKENHPDNLLANALFADGSAAALIEANGSFSGSLRLDSFYADLCPQGKTDMAWNVGDFGFHMRLSEYVPDLIREGISQLTARLMKRAGLNTDQIDRLAVHPGGKRILQAVEAALGIDRMRNAEAHNVLANYGNMSSATILFVLQEIMDQPRDIEETILSFAFGPGLTLESGLITALPGNNKKPVNTLTEINVRSV